ncbi:MAG: S41 family peptidase [Bacteroidales bacterium]|nr:S41 family peptidase [Bacteroidales bacterium]
MTTKSNNSGAGWLIIIAMVLGMILGIMFTPWLSRTSRASSAPLGLKVERVTQLVERAYVDDIDAATLSERIISAILDELDPHCHYFSAQALAREEESIRGNFEGIGVVLKYMDDSVFVNSVMPAGPAAGSGLVPGDKLLRVDSTDLSGSGLEPDQVVSHIRGPRGTTANLLVQSYGQSQPHTVSVARGVVSTPSVAYHGMLDEGTGYIRVTRFAESTGREFHDALADLVQRRMKRLIVDLRGNSGGVLESATDMANELLPRGSVIVYTEGAHSRRKTVRANAGGLFTTGQLAVVIDEYSASASEIVAGAVQDNDRGLVVGRRSFGKGLVQRQFELGDGSAVWLTVARYYTPSGRCIQRPYDRGTDEYYTEFLNRMFEQSMTDTALASLNDSTPYYTLNGRTVYGGGGIYPDHFLPYFTDSLLAYVNRLHNRGCIDRTAFRYTRANAATLVRQYPTADSFTARFNPPQSLIDSVVADGQANGIALDRRSLDKYRGFVATTLKAYIGESLHGDGLFTRIVLDNDDEISRTRKLLAQ